jgi:hypothetical protein
MDADITFTFTHHRYLSPASFQSAPDTTRSLDVRRSYAPLQPLHQRQMCPRTPHPPAATWQATHDSLHHLVAPLEESTGHQGQ